MNCPLCAIAGERVYASFADFRIRQCLHCGFRFINTEDCDYPSNAQYLYDEPVGKITPHQPHVLRRKRDILRFRRPPGKTLDIGCGKGELVMLLEEEGFTAAGMEMKEHLVSHLGRHYPGPRWLSCDLAALVRDGERFDVVSLYHVLEHISQPLDFLKVVQKVCVPGALVVIEVPNTSGWEAQLKGKRWHYYKVDHVNYFRLKDLVGFSKILGWEVLAVKGYQHFSYPQNVWWKDVVKGTLGHLGFKDVISIFAQVGNV